MTPKKARKVKAWALIFTDYDKSQCDIEQLWMEKPKGTVYTNTEQYDLVPIEIKILEGKRRPS